MLIAVQRYANIFTQQHFYIISTFRQSNRKSIRKLLQLIDILKYTKNNNL